MCGLVGMAGALAHPDEMIMKRLLMFDYFRGTDSTGLAAIRKTGDVKIGKVASHPPDLFQMKSFTDALSAYASKIFIGHNRAATKGKITSFNAHPFNFGDTTCAHNGTLSVSSFNLLNKMIGEDYDVDSMALVKAVDDFGIDNVIPLIEGAWALTWYDDADKTLNFIRNKERPLWYAFNKEGTKLYWASEWPIMQHAMKDNGKDVELWQNEEGYAFFPFATDIVYSIKPEEMQLGPNGEAPEFLRRKLTGKEPTPVKPVPPFQGQTGQSWTKNNTGTSSTTPTTCTDTSKGDTTVFLFGNDEDPYGGYIGRDRFEELTQWGCSYCGEKMEYGDKGVTIIEGSEIALCCNCSSRGDTETSVVLVENINAVLRAA